MVSKNDIRVGLKFETNHADLDISKQKLSEIITSLQAVQTQMKKTSSGKEMSEQFQKASQEAQKLEQILNQSWNSKLGQLDLSKVKQQLAESNMTIASIRTNLAGAGAQGNQAFNNLANSILNTNVQLRQSSELLNKMALTMANTIRFGISSSIFNNLTSSISKAYDYAKKLDKSLNDIRIVSDASADEMERFAKYANAAAKNLGSSTLDYTKGALIYFQQGLDEQAVKERTDITIKMAHVTESTAEEVSDYMTAIWNNFAKGGERLEYFADVLAKLGAETASSSEEISQGLEKFASVANAVGLSYDYAAAALATVTATTRQSADVVGTAFKTLFARIQDLELGDEGTVSIGKYSEALEKFDIHVLDSQGNLKDMNLILDEMGTKWQIMSDAQKVALAQNVAGVRQYTQLMALMENWDFFKQNVDSARNATGALQKQQEIYLESVEAHLEKLNTEWERTYNTLFDKNATNALVDSLSAVIKQFNDFIEGLGGGLKALSFMGLQIANIFNKQIGRAIERQIENFELWKRNRDSLKMKAEVIGDQKNFASQQTMNEVSTAHIAKGENVSTGALSKEAGIAERLLNIRRALSTEQYKELTALQQQIGLEQTQLDNINDYNNKYKESSTTLQSNKEYYEEELEQQEKILTYLELGTKTQAKQGNEVARVNEIMEEINSENSQMSEMLAGMGPEQEQILTTLQNEELSDEQIAQLIEKQKRLIEEQKGKIEETNSAIQAKQAIEDGTNIKLQEQINKKEQIILATEKQAQRELMIQKTIAITTGLMQAMVSLVGGITTALNQNSSASEKANGYWSAAVGTVSSIANMLLPGSGIIVQGLGAVGKGILESTGLWEDFENHFKSTNERLEELNKQMSEFKKKQEDAMSDLKDKNSAEEYFKSIQDRFEYLQRLAEKGLLPDDLQSEYEGYLNKVQQYNQDIVVSYDAQGRMITKNNQAIQETINKLQEENKLLLSQTYGGENWTEYAEQQENDYNSKRKLWEKTQENYRSQLYDTTRGHGINGQQIVGEWGIRDFVSNADTDTLLSFSHINNSYAENFSKIFNPNDWENDMKNPEKWKEQANKYVEEYIKWMEDNEYIDWRNEKSKNQNLKGFEEYIDRYYQELLNIKSNYETDKAKTIGSQSVDLSFILNNLKYDASQRGTYENLSTQIGQENTDTILNAYMNGIDISSKEFTDKNGNLQYDKIRQKIKDFQNNLIGLFEGDNGEFLKEKLQEILNIDPVELTSQEYETQMIQRIEEFLSKIGSKEQFDKIKNSLPALFGVSNVSAQWKDGKAQLGANGGNIVTAGEQKARDIGNLIAERNTGEAGDKKAFADNIEQYLQNNLNELDLQKLNTTKLSEDFNQLLYNAIDQDTGDLRAGLSIENVLQDAIDKQMSDSEKMDSKASNAVASMKQEIENFDLDSTELKDYTKHLMEMADESKELADNLEEDAEAAAIVAKSILRMNRGVDSLKKNFKGWNDVLTKSSKSSAEYWEALDGMKDAMSDILDVEKDAIDSDFITKHLKDIEKAAKGNAKAIDRLRDAYADEILLNFTIDNNLDQNLQKELTSTLNDIQSKIPELKIGAVDNADFLQSCQDMIEKAGLSVDQANALFNALGFDAEFETTTEPQTQKVPRVVTNRDVTARDEFGNPTRWVETSYQDGFDTFEGQVETFAMATNGKTPKISKLTKKATGSMNNYSSTNKGGNGGKNGGGGKKTAEKADAFKPDKDIYHKVNTQIAKIDSTLNKLQKDEERFLGGKLFKNYLSQWKNLNTQIDNYKEKLKIARGEQDKLKKKLEKQGAVFGEDNTVTNYQAVLDKKEAEIKSKIDKYNKERKKKSDKTNKARLEEIETLKQEYEELVNDLNRADELASDFIPEIEENIRAALDNQIEINIKAFEIKIKYSADIKDLTTEVNDFIEKSINGLSEDNRYGNFKLNQKNMAASLTKDDNGNLIGHLADQTEQLIRMQAQYDQLRAQGASIFGDNDAEGWEKHKEQLEAFMEEYNSYLEAQKEQLSLIREQKEAIDELMDSQLEGYGKINDQLEHNKKLMQLIYGESAASKIEKISKAQIDNAEVQLNYAHQINEESANYLITQELALQNAKDQVDELAAAGDTESSLYQQAYNAMLEAEKNRDEAAQQSLERAAAEQEALDNYVDTINNDLVNAIEIALETLNNGLTESGKGLDYAREQWDLIGKEADIYLDTINNLQGQKDLESKYLESIEKATNPNVQKKLKAAMDAELKALKDKDTLTQYDLDRANKRYQIMLAEIALEEAQQNKNKMRLRRDSQGNYRYQYVADEENIRKAQEKLTSLYTDLYNFDKERFLEVNNTILGIEADTQDKIREIYADTTKSKEEKEQEAALVIQSYNDQIKKWQDERAEAEKNVNESAFDDLKRLYGEDSEEYAKACEDKQKTMAELIPQFKSEGNAIAANTELVDKNKEAWEAAEDAANNAANTITNKIIALEGPLDQLEQGVNKNIDAINKIIEQGTSKIAEYKTQLAEMNTTLANNQTLLKQLNEEKGVVDLVTKSWKDLTDVKKDAMDEVTKEENENGILTTNYNEENANQDTENSSGGSEPERASGNQGVPVTSPKITNKFGQPATWTEVKDSKAKTKALQEFLMSIGIGLPRYGADGKYGDETISAVKKFQEQKLGISSGDGKFGPDTWARAKNAGFDTGGYTGSWGNNGKLAFLHQKELVLNAQDTENILNTVAIMRNLMATMNQDILSRLAGVSVGTITNLGSGNAGLEQNVHIDANFPNATNSNEIEEALRNLVNVASQRITK